MANVVRVGSVGEVGEVGEDELNLRCGDVADDDEDDEDQWVPIHLPRRTSKIQRRRLRAERASPKGMMKKWGRTAMMADVSGASGLEDSEDPLNLICDDKEEQWRTSKIWRSTRLRAERTSPKGMTKKWGRTAMMADVSGASGMEEDPLNLECDDKEEQCGGRLVRCSGGG